MKKININVVLIGLAVLLSAGLLLWRNMSAQKGETAVVRIDGMEEKMEISLEENGIYTITEGKFTVTLEVQDGRIRFINSICPDHICEGYGFISCEDDSAICMPAGVAVLIK